LGVWNVDDMLKRMSSRLMAEWMAYYSLEPFGDQLQDIHLSNITASLANANRKRGSGTVQPKEFRLWKEVRQFDPQEFYDRLKSAFKKDKE
jgi:hypothetical protein